MMTRKEFLKICGILGVGIPLPSTLKSCSKDGDIKVSFEGKVIIIGAGAGGLSAGYLLHQLGIDFEILEASSTYGGRMKTDTSFADFPIPLGAEWLHTQTGIFQEIVNDSSVLVNVNTINYNSQNDTYAHWANGELAISELDDSDIKFVNYSWLNFFEEYLLPSVSGKITYNSAIQSIDYSSDQIILNTHNQQYAPSMRNSPCARLMIFIMPKITARPALISTSEATPLTTSSPTMIAMSIPETPRCR